MGVNLPFQHEEFALQVLMDVRQLPLEGLGNQNNSPLSFGRWRQAVIDRREIGVVKFRDLICSKLGLLEKDYMCS